MHFAINVGNRNWVGICGMLWILTNWTGSNHMDTSNGECAMLSRSFTRQGHRYCCPLAHDGEDDELMIVPWGIESRNHRVEERETKEYRSTGLTKRYVTIEWHGKDMGSKLCKETFHHFVKWEVSTLIHSCVDQWNQLASRYTVQGVII
jgi:hypothetical protein